MRRRADTCREHDAPAYADRERKRVHARDQYERTRRPLLLASGNARGAAQPHAFTTVRERATSTRAHDEHASSRPPRELNELGARDGHSVFGSMPSARSQSGVGASKRRACMSNSPQRKRASQYSSLASSRISWMTLQILPS